MSEDKIVVKAKVINLGYQKHRLTFDDSEEEMGEKIPSVENKVRSKIFNRALAELKKETGIDFYKVITGDEKENRRLELKYHQEAMNQSKIIPFSDMDEQDQIESVESMEDE